MILIRFILIALSALQPATQPTSRASATTNPFFDLSSPQLAMQSLHSAIDRNDPAALTSILFQSDDSHRKLNNAYGAMILATRQLANAVAEKFGTTGDMLALSAASMPDISTIESADVVEKHDRSISLKLRGRARPMIFQRDDANLWHVDLLSFADASTDDLPAQLAMLSELSTSISELAGDVRGDRFHTIGDVKAAIQDRVHSAIARSLRHDSATTNPATNPSTNPASRPS